MNDEELMQTISTYNSYLDKMIVAVQHFYDDLENSGFNELNLATPMILEGFGWLNDAGNSLVKLNMLNETLYQNFTGIIKNLGEAMENKDYVLLHDICEFELLPLLDELKIRN